jgi:SpoVK/Ycf46/Vps4 family AAA+-type ATPase
MIATDAAPVRTPARKTAIYLLGSAALLATYAALATVLWINRDFVAEGPLGFRAPAVTVPLNPATSLSTVKQQCIQAGLLTVIGGDTIKVVAVRVQSQVYYACYEVDEGKAYDAAVIDADGFKAPDRIAKQYGAWPWIGLVKSSGELYLGGFTLAVMLALYFQYYRRARPGPPNPARWWQTSRGSFLLALTGPLLLTPLFRRVQSRPRRLRLLYQWAFGLITMILFGLLVAGISDRMSAVVLLLLLSGSAFGWLGGRLLLAPPDFGAPEQSPLPVARVQNPDGPNAGRTMSPDENLGSDQNLRPEGRLDPDGAGSRATWAPARTARRAGVRSSTGRSEPRPAYLKSPSSLPTFADVGGMQALKDELADTFGLLLAFGAEADVYRIAFNGVLLHGPPGVGKTFVAKATAGEFGLTFAHISTGDLVSKFVGESAANIREVFSEAARNVPCLLFFDEFDSIAERRDSATGEESRRVVNQLLQSLEEWRPVRDLVIMAATNHLDTLDAAVVRAGRFDRHIRVDLPDLVARRAILGAQLRGRPTATDIDLDDLAERTAGRTPATISRVVEAAALSAFRSATESGTAAPINHVDLRAALAGLGGSDRPTVEDWSWDRLILPEAMKAELKQVQALVGDPDLAKAYGVDVPSGLLLAGPPGTGKTTIARVLAAQTGFSFYSRTAADLTSKWVGESEASVARLFARARENAPSFVFIDEIDAIAGARSDVGSYLDRTLTQLLTEIDGLVKQVGVFVVAATNRPEMLDPALLRGGRLSRTITIPLPDVGDRRRLLSLFTARMPLADVDLDQLSGATAGYSGADLEALCQQAAINSMLAATRAETSGPSTVTAAAFAEALRSRRSGPVPMADAPDERAGDGGYL